MVSEHQEIEAKFAADSVSADVFRAYCNAHLQVIEYKLVEEAPDDYYKSGANVVRERHGPHELTVKRRKTESSTRDRQEVDLHLDRDKPKDVAAFLEAVGFQKVFRLVKTAHIFWARLSPNLVGTVVWYQVWRADKPQERRVFVEVEAEKGSDVTPDTAKRHVREQVKALQDEFKLAEPLNESLWEIYSGERYQVQE